MKIHCPKCGNDTDQPLTTNVQDNSEGCWSCIAGPDQWMLRMVVLQREDQETEVHTLWAANNKEAMLRFYRRGVVSMRCVPLPN